MSETGHRILLVEDDMALGYLLKEYLQLKGLQVTWATHGKQALKAIESDAFDLAVLDVMMPEMDGFTLAENLMRSQERLPFIFLTAKSLKVDVLKGFSLGAVDYLKKPIDEEELVIRIKKLLSTLQAQTATDIEVKELNLGEYTFNPRNQELTFRQETRHLTARESDLLSYLSARRNVLCDHRDILLDIWGKSDYFNKKSLNVFITRLRKYLDRHDTLKIENVHGRGYILREEK